MSDGIAHGLRRQIRYVMRRLSRELLRAWLDMEPQLDPRGLADGPKATTHERFELRGFGLSPLRRRKAGPEAGEGAGG